MDRHTALYCEDIAPAALQVDTAFGFVEVVVGGDSVISTNHYDSSYSKHETS